MEGVIFFLHREMGMNFGESGVQSSDLKWHMWMSSGLWLTSECEPSLTT